MVRRADGLQSIDAPRVAASAALHAGRTRVYPVVPLAPPPPPLRLSTRPAGAVAVGVGVGIGVGRAAPDVSPLLWAALGGALVVALAVYVGATRQRMVTLRPLALAATVLGVAVAVGAARDAGWRAEPPGGLARVAATVDTLADRPETTVWATLADVPRRSDWSIRFAADVDSLSLGASASPASGRVQVSLLHNEGRSVYPALRPGDRVRLAGRLEPLPTRRNPADMDYGAYLRRQGVVATVEVRDETGAVFLAPSRRPVTRAAEAVRRHVRKTLARYVASDTSRGLLLALLLADRSAIEAPTLDAFRETGLMHLLAVSGLHVGLVGLALYALLKPVLLRLHVRRRRVEAARAVVTLAVLAVYVVVAGASVSVVRAFVMVAVLIVGRAAERRVDSLNALGLAALALLVHRPSALFDVGFQLSFGAVAALVTITPILNGAVPERVRQSGAGWFVVGSVTTSLAATLGTAPALLAHFGRLPLGGLVLNLPAIPLTAVTLGSGLGCALAAPVPPLARAFGACADLTGRWLVVLTESGADTLGWATYDGFFEAPSALLACALGIGALALWHRPVARRRVALAAVASVAVGTWAGFARGDAAPTLDVVFLDVGQGDATLLSTPGGRHVLIDAGIRSPYSDEGARTVVPHLDRFGIGRLDVFVLTHADADHVGGALSVLASVPVGRLVTNGQPGDTDLWNRVLRLADSLGVPVQPVEAGDTLAVDPAVRIRVLGPSASRAGPNDASVVLRIEHGATRWLLTGDAEVAGESALVDRYGASLAVDVVKVGHHGSETSSTAGLVAAAGAPAFAVVSVARRNRYGLPDDAPLDRWRRVGAEVLLTSGEGAVWLRSDGREVERVRWRE